VRRAIHKENLLCTSNEIATKTVGTWTKVYNRGDTARRAQGSARVCAVVLTTKLRMSHESWGSGERMNGTSAFHGMVSHGMIEGSKWTEARREIAGLKGVKIKGRI
jgi:hypothetical protein